ncbi:MAG: CHAT domain-containing protein [Pseudanabaenaceae cyanobacterium bins.68]|nr:CHAT domain-containing protein [Pseudanabaenaceae cyanobacterium bins.68]
MHQSPRMKSTQLWLGQCSLTYFLILEPGTAQQLFNQPSPPNIPGVILDGTTNSQILEGNVIAPGSRAALQGNNLFHSYQELQVPAQGITFGVGNSGIDGTRVNNIINRVTGSQPSLINGAINSVRDFPRANVYLLNPNGIVFSANGSLNVGSSFLASTAPALGFSNGDLVLAEPNSKFSIATPTNFQFSLETGAPLINQANLTVRSGANITLAAGRIVSTGSLNAPSGSVDVAAVAGKSTVTLRSPTAILGLEVRAGAVAPPWQGQVQNLSQLAKLLTGNTNLEADRAVINADGSLQLVNSTAPLGINNLVTPTKQLDFNGRLEVRPGDLALSSVSAGEARILASKDLLLLVPNLQTARSLLLRAENRILVRDSIAQPAIISAIGNLTFQAKTEIDLLALNHSSSTISSGGVLALRTDGRVLADAWLRSEGTLSVRTLDSSPGTILSALEFSQDAGGTVQFLDAPPPTLDRLLPKLSTYRTIIDLDARAVDRTKEVAKVEKTESTEAVPAEASNQLGPGALGGFGKPAIASSTATNAADLLLQKGRILEAQQALDLSILAELESYLGKTLERKIPELPPELLSPNQNQLYDRLVKLQQQLNQVTAELGQALLRPDRQAALGQIQQKLSQDLDLLLAQPEVKTLDRLVSQEKLRQLQENLRQLPQPTVLLYPLIRTDRLELILVPPQGQPIRHTTRLDQAELLREISQFRRALETVYDPAIDPRVSAQKLYSWLIAPLEPDLAKIGAKAILYAPNSQLRYVPLAALHDRDRWLVERFQINNITAATLQNFTRSTTTNKQILAGAVTQPAQIQLGDRQLNFDGLPFAAQEIDNLETIFPNRTKRLQDQSFSPQAMLSQANGYNILHLATHGFFRPGKPQESFILFGEQQRQTLADIGTWSLPNVDLVVLSACDTAIGETMGDGQEILGFGYLMQQSGARAAIASLWAVDDGGTQAWMEIFYSFLQRPGMTEAEAIRQTQIVLITGNFAALGDHAPRIQQHLRDRLSANVTEFLSHPYYWAPFILIGNGMGMS